MKKGITPVIAIIILLLIAIAITGAAYTYIAGYWVSLTAKAVEISDIQCSLGNVTIYMKNIGTDQIAEADVSVTRTFITSGTGTFEPILDGLPADPQGGFKIQEGNSTASYFMCGSGNTCKYDITVGGRVYSRQISCP